MKPQTERGNNSIFGSSWREFYFFKATRFLTKHALIFSLKYLSLYFVGPKKKMQNSRRISCNISLQRIKKNSPTSFCRYAGRTENAKEGSRKEGGPAGRGKTS